MHTKLLMATSERQKIPTDLHFTTLKPQKSSINKYYVPFFVLKGFWGQPQGLDFPSPQATMLALRLNCSTAALTTPQKVLSIRRLVKLKMLDFSDSNLDISR